MEMLRVIELMENVADYRGQIAKYKTYVNAHPNNSFGWEEKIAKMEKVLSSLEFKLQIASFGI